MPSQQLVQPRPTRTLAPDHQRLRSAGWLLVAGAMVSLAAGATPSMYDLYTSQTPQQFLELLADRSTTWVGVHLAFLAGVVLITLGLAALTSALADSRGRTLATIGLTLFLVATPIRVLQTIFAATVTVTAADQTTHSGAVPPAYQLLEGFLWGQPNWALAVFIALTALTRPRQPAVILTGALATTAVLLGVGSLAAAPAWRTIGLAVLCGLAAFLVDVYLY